MTIPEVRAKLEALAAGIERDEPVGLHSRTYIPLMLALLEEREAYAALGAGCSRNRIDTARARVAALLEAM